MIPELQQEQATLYALGLLDADEAAVFEDALVAAPELAELVRELQETAAHLAWLPESSTAAPSPSPELRERLLRRVAAQANPVPVVSMSTSAVRRRTTVPTWIPWALAALLFVCLFLLGTERDLLQRQVLALQTLADAPTPAPLEALSKVAFVELEPTPDAPVKPRAAVLWDPKQRRGVLRVEQLLPPDSGKDYQLWVVEAGRKEPVNAGLVRVSVEGQANVSFQPDHSGSDDQVVALAISLEKVGGSPTNQGPILFLGKL